MTTVNAPHREQLTAEQLFIGISDDLSARRHAGHIWCFFGDVPVQQQVEFAAAFGMEESQLLARAKRFSEMSGANFPILDQLAANSSRP